MRRNCIYLIMALLECILLAWPSGARASYDLFSVKQYEATGPFAGTTEVCQADIIRHPLSLANVVDLALCNNPQTRSLWASSRAQAAQYGASLSSYLPTLSGPASIVNSQNLATSTNVTTKGVSLSISYLLFDFGGREAGADNAKQLLVAANATRDATLQSVYLSAVQAYYTLLSSRASVQGFRAAEDAASRSLNAAEVRYKAGAATPADRLQAQTSLSQATLNRITAEGTAASAQGTLATIMGFDASQPFELAPVQDTSPDPVAERGIGKLIEEARRKRSDLQAADAQIRAAEANLVAARAAGLPTVNLTGTVSRSQSTTAGVSSTSRSNSIGVSVNLPWFSGYRDTYNTRAAKAQLEGKIADRDQLANQIALDVWKAYQTLRTNSQALQAANDLLASAEQSEKMASGRYQAGAGNILDVLTAQSALANAQQQRVTALYNFQSSRFALAQAMGELDLTLIGKKN